MYHSGCRDHCDGTMSSLKPAMNNSAPSSCSAEVVVEVAGGPIGGLFKEAGAAG